MEGGQQARPRARKEQVKEVGELPLESSPYVKYSDVEDYKQQGYGTHGHLPAIDTSRHGGATEGPTLSGTGLSQEQARAADPGSRPSTV